MNKCHLILFVICLAEAIAGDVFGQRESSTWYFGKKAGIKFIGDSVFALVDSEMKSYAFHSCSMSDDEGNLLFYSRSDTVYTSNHLPMPNGQDLVFSEADEHSIVIPRPGHPSQYYLFVAGHSYYMNPQGGSNPGLNYHLIDMELNGGYGDVTNVKNVVLMDSTEEKIDATLHANGMDYWVMVRQGGSNKYHSFLVTENGVSTTPVTTTIGMVSNNYLRCQGSIQFSHEGNMMAASLTGADRVEIFDFNNQSGILSNLRAIDLSPLAGFGMEFSPDDSKLYVGGPNQLDLSNPTQAAIQSSHIWLKPNYDYPFMIGMQLALNGRIYGATLSGTSSSIHLSSINNPNASGLACDYQDSVVYLQGNQAGLVPKFLNQFMRVNFYADTVCLGSPTTFRINFANLSNPQWNFGDSASSSNTSSLFTPSHTYTSPGTYTVRLIVQNGVKTDTVVNQITVQQTLFPDIGLDTGLCQGDSVLLSPQQSYAAYNWSNGDTSQSTWVYTAGSYTLQATNDSGCSAFDTISIQGYETPFFSLGADIYDCEDHVSSGVVLEGPAGASAYQWGSGNTSQNDTIYGFGVYSLSVSNAEGCSFSDTILIDEDTCVGINSPLSSQRLEIFPNPNDGHFTINLAEQSSGKLQIYSSEGIRCWDQTVSNRQTLPIGLRLTAGVYFVVIKTGDGTFSESFVVK